MPFNYPSGEKIRIDDRVMIGSLSGKIVAIIDDNEYSAGIIPNHWSHYKTGILVESEEAGLLLYEIRFLVDFEKANNLGST